MPKEVIMPQMGESVVEGTILKWLIQEGQRVERDQSLVEISTDKVDTEIPSPVAGLVTKILHYADETVPVGTVIVLIEEGEEGVKAPQAPETLPAEAPPKSREEHEEMAEQRAGLEKRYSPLVRRLAKEYGVDLERVGLERGQGTGTGGRITKEDLLEYIETTRKTTIPARPKIGETKEAEGLPEELREEIIPVSAKRKIIAERMVQSKRTAPHVTTTFEVDMSRVARYREANKDALLKGEGVHLTYLPFILSAAASALKEYPLLNSSWSEDGTVVKRYVHIGIAVSIEDGLIVPVIKDADRKGLLELAKESQDLAKRAREKRLKVDEVQGGTFTITNYGIGGSLFGTPIILQPQTAILGVGTISKRAVVIHDAIAIRPMVYLSLSFDHRVIDGTQADQFLSKIKEILEGWGEKSEKVSGTESGFGGIW